MPKEYRFRIHYPSKPESRDVHWPEFEIIAVIVDSGDPGGGENCPLTDIEILK